MQHELISKEIDGRTYEFQKLGAKKSVKLLLDISKVIGKPFSMLMGSFQPGKKFADQDIKFDLVGEAVSALTADLDSDFALGVIETLTAADNVLCDGVRVKFDSHYAGELPHLFRVLGAALEVQYGNFFVAFSAVVPRKNHRHTTQE